MPFWKKTLLNDGTGYIQLEDDNDNKKQIVIKLLLDQRPENTFAHNRPQHNINPNSINRGLVSQDSRPIMIVTSRRQLVMNNDNDDKTNKNIALDFNLHLLPNDVNDEDLTLMTSWHEAMIHQLNLADSGIRKLTNAEEESIKKIKRPQAILMKNVIENRNGMVVDYNEVASASLRCNTAMYLLGSQGQCIAVFFYLFKYISKDANMLTDSLTVISEAKAHIIKYPTIANENETQNMRDFKKFCQRVLNSSPGIILK